MEPKYNFLGSPTYRSRHSVSNNMNFRTSNRLRTKCVQNLQNVIKVYKLVCRLIWMHIIEKCPEVFYVELFLLAATPFSTYRNLLSQLLKVMHTPIWAFKMIKINELVGTQTIFKLLSHYLFKLSSIYRL